MCNQNCAQSYMVISLKAHNNKSKGERLGEGKEAKKKMMFKLVLLLLQRGEGSILSHTKG